MNIILLMLFMILTVFPIMTFANSPTVNIPLLESLTNADGVSGFEGPVRKLLVHYWKPYLSHLKIDGLGNLYGYSGIKKGRPRVLIMAHMDEVGLMVSSITERGYVHFIPLGGMLNKVLLAQKWVISTAKGPVVGYTGIESAHVIPDYKNTPEIPFYKMFIDVGARNRSQAVNQFGIRPGLPVAPDTKFSVLSNKNRYLAKAFDDRASLAVITQVLHELNGTHFKNNLLVAATTQEEVGMRGAETIFHDMHPNLVINLEAGVAEDFPLSLAPPAVRPKLGSGPCLWVYSASEIPNNKLVNDIINIAKKNHIPLQLEANMIHGGSDIASIQTKGDGVPVVTLAIPVRYMHSPYGIIDKNDYINMIKLVYFLVQDISLNKIELK